MEQGTNDQCSQVRLPQKQIALRIAVIAAAYFLAHQVSFLYPDAERVLMAIWPAAGIALAALLLNPRRSWPVIVISLFVAGTTANWLAGRPPFASVGFMVANVLESTACAWVVGRLCGERSGFVRVRHVLALLLSATLINTGTALIGAAAATLTPHATYWNVWRTWCIAHGLGILLITPLIMVWSDWRDLLRGFRWSRVIEGGAFLAVCGTLAALVFDTRIPDVFLCEPFLVSGVLAWGALRLGLRGVTAASVVLAVIVITSSAVTTGPLLWGGGTQTERLLVAQAYVSVTAVTGFLLAAAYAESRKAERLSHERSVRLAATAEALRASRELLSSIIEGTSDVVFVKNSFGRYVLFNSAAARFAGKAASEVIGQDETSLMAPDEARVLMDRDLAVMHSSRMSTSEDVVTTADGIRRTFHATRGPIFDGEGHVIGMFNIARDITERKRVEEELARYRNHLEELVEKRTQEMEVAREEARQADRLASLGTFAAGIAHEMNNPLGMILLGTDAALASLDDREAVARLLNQNKALVRRCAQIAQGVLDFSRKQPAEKQPLDLNEVVRRGVGFSTESDGKHGVTMETLLATSLNPVFGNAVELEQVVVNLVRNAVQACGDRGRVTIETCEVGDKVRLVVKDDGCGMTPEQVQRVFDPFYTTRLNKNGTGLGLSVVHGIISDHKGSINVASEEGRGTTFTVEFARHIGSEADMGKGADG